MRVRYMQSQLNRLMLAEVSKRLSCDMVSIHFSRLALIMLYNNNNNVYKIIVFNNTI